MDGLYRKVIEFTGDGVYRYAIDDGRILMANQGLVRILDFDGTPDDLVGRCLKDVLVYEEQAGTIRRTLLEKGEIHGFEYHFKTLKGESRWVLHDSFLTTDRATGRRTVDAVVKDITYRKEAERALAEEKERLAVTLRSIGDGVIAADTRGRVVLMNSAAEELTGWRLAEAAGRPMVDVFRIVNEQNREPCENPVEKVLRHGVVVGLANHTALIARDGAERSIADSGAPIRSTSGDIVGVVLVFRDVTEQRRAEAERLRFHADLERLVKVRTADLERTNERLTLEVASRERVAARLEAALGELQRSNRELEQFAYVASHDLQEPLRKVQAFGDLLRSRLSGQLDERGEDYLTRMTKAAERMQALITDLLSYSRVTTQGAPFVPVALDGVAAEVVSDLEPLMRQTGGRVQVAALPEVLADRMQMRRLLQNLIQNALKFHREGQAPDVAVRGRADGDWAEIEVEDRGIGFEPSQAERIFLPFQRLHARGEYEGTGIGLAICRKIVERHGGVITALAEPDRGARFTVRLPLRPPGGVEGGGA